MVINVLMGGFRLKIQCRSDRHKQRTGTTQKSSSQILNSTVGRESSVSVSIDVARVLFCVICLFILSP